LGAPIAGDSSLGSPFPAAAAAAPDASLLESFLESRAAASAVPLAPPLANGVPFGPRIAGAVAGLGSPEDLENEMVQAMADVSYLRTQNEQLRRQTKQLERLVGLRQVGAKAATAQELRGAKLVILLSTAVVGCVLLLTVVACVLHNQSTSKQGASARSPKALGLVGLAHDPDLDGPLKQEVASSTSSSFRLCPCGLCGCCGCCCRGHTAVLLWTFIFIWSGGMAVLWKFGIVQPFIKQMGVYMYLVLFCVCISGIICYEVWSHVRGALAEAYHVLTFIHDKIDDLMQLAGLEPDSPGSRRPRLDNPFGGGAGGEDEGAAPQGTKRAKRKGACC